MTGRPAPAVRSRPCAAAALVAAGVALVVGVAALLAGPAAAASSPAPSRVLFHLHDRRIDEASGLAVGIRSPGVVYVQNDSGDTNRFFALNAHTGGTVATVIVGGARNVDWEDIAAAPDAAGTPSVWLADIGDNAARRPNVEVYRVPEPRLRATGPGRVVRIGHAEVWRLRYPSGPTNAESLAVSPAGTAYVVTKALNGQSAVYQLPSSADGGRIQTLHRVGRIEFHPHDVPNPFGFVGELTATAATMAPDGRLFAVRTYASAYVWQVGPGGVPAALHSRPTRVDLPRERQGEGMAIRGDHLLIDSEGRGSAVSRVRLPTALLGASQTPSTSSPSAGADPSSAAVTHEADGTASPSAPTTTPAPRGKLFGGVSLAAGVVLAILIGISLVFLQRRRRR